MTDQQQHPIIPPPQLVRQWLENSPEDDGFGISNHIASQAACWGSDQELDACCEWVEHNFAPAQWWSDKLRAARRPKPLSLKDKALKALLAIESGTDRLGDSEIIRQALEQLND